MRKEGRMRACVGCNEQVLISAYGIGEKGRRRRVCNTCLERRDAVDALPKWDWACAVHKAASMHANHDKRHPALFSPMLTAEILRCLMEQQSGRCFLSRRAFTLPLDTELTANMTLTAWGSKLPQNLAEVIPVLVRGDMTMPWEPGNIFLIASTYQIFYETCNSLAEFRNLWRSIQDTTSQIPDQRTLVQIEIERVKRRMETTNGNTGIVRTTDIIQEGLNRQGSAMADLG